MKRSDLVKQAKKPKISVRAQTFLSMLTSRDTDEVLYRLKEIDLHNLKFAKSIYEGYQRLKSRTGGSLNHYCFVLSIKANYRSPLFYRNWYNIYRHFCIRSGIDENEMTGIDYKILKFISESGSNTFNKIVTQEAVSYLKDPLLPYQTKWKYIRELKTQIKSESELLESIYLEHKKQKNSIN